MGRPRIKGIDLELFRWLRKLGLGWRPIERRYYSETKREVSFMTLKRRLMEAELAGQEGNNGHYQKGNMLPHEIIL